MATSRGLIRILKIDGCTVENRNVMSEKNLSFTVSKGTTGVYEMAVDGQTGVFVVFTATLSFRDRRGNALTNTSIYYCFSSGKEISYLGTTDNEGKITSDNPELPVKRSTSGPLMESTLEHIHQCDGR